MLTLSSIHPFQDTVNALTNQNTILERRLNSEQEKRNENMTESDTRVEHMSSSVKQLEMERDQLMKQLEEEKTMHAEVEERFTTMQTELATQGMFNLRIIYISCQGKIEKKVLAYMLIIDVFF